MAEKILETKIIGKYKDVAMNMLHYSFPLLRYEELEKAVDYSISKRFKNTDVRLHNNYKNKNVNITLLDLAEYIMQREPIITPYGVMFKRHGECPNPIAKLLETFMNNRSKHKDIMLSYPRGTEMYEKYNLLQLLDKIDANGSYGSIGQYSCLFYNIYVAASVTAQGQSAISAAGLFFESFLANNVKFGSLNEVITFINNVVNEAPNRKYNDNEILNCNITVNDCFVKLMMGCGFNYIPDEKDLQIVWELLSNLSVENINRIYYKNNLYEFMENKVMTNAIIYILQKMEDPYLDPRVNKVPDDIRPELDEFLSLLTEYVYYGYQYIDRVDKYGNMVRSVCIITDTDSTIVSLDAWYRYILSKVENIPMKIKQRRVKIFERIEVDEFGDFTEFRKAFLREEPEYDYDFYDDEIIEMEKSIDPTNILPKEGLRYSIINIMAYCLSKLILDYMDRYSHNSNAVCGGKKNMLIMKNEYLFKRLLLLSVKKFYASIMELQEGHLVPKSEQLEIKGLTLSKGTLNKSAQKVLKNILYEDVLTSERINPIKVVKKLAIFEKQIYNSLQKGEKQFCKPIKINSFNSYETPFTNQGIKAELVWNATITGNLHAFNMDEQNNLDVVKMNINALNVDNIKDTYPEVHKKLLELMNDPKLCFTKGIDCIGIPLDEEIPKWVLEFVNYESIISDNIKCFPIESLGIYRGLKNNQYTNIISI